MRGPRVSFFSEAKTWTCVTHEGKLGFSLRPSVALLLPNTITMIICQDNQMSEDEEKTDFTYLLHPLFFCFDALH